MTTQQSPAPDEAMRATRIVLRPIANPFALGFIGLGGDTLVASGIELHWIPPSDHTHASIIIMVFAPTLQVIACVFGFLGRDAVAATGMGVLAVTWELIGLTLLTSPPGTYSTSLGILLFLSATGVLLSAAVAALSKWVPAIVMGLTGFRFLTAGLVQIFGRAPWDTISGALGCALAAAAVYGAISLEMEDIRRRTILPTGRHGAGELALEPYLSDQIGSVLNEAGVRKQL